jgi:hypothetical protein
MLNNVNSVFHARQACLKGAIKVYKIKIFHPAAPHLNSGVQDQEKPAKVFAGFS